MLSLTACRQAQPVLTGTAIIFGASDYPGTVNDLPFTRNDAEAMASLLASQGGWDVHLQLDGLATKQQLDSLLGNLSEDSRQNSPVLFFYAGHGTWDEYSKYFLVPVDALADYGRLISQDDIFELLAKHKIQHPILILDSCNSGGFALSDGVYDAISPDYNPWQRQETSTVFAQIANLASGAFVSYAQYKNTTRAIVLAAAGPPELSWESSGLGHGIFTWFVLKAAEDPAADRNGDGYISTTELYLYASRQLDAKWNQTNSYVAERIYMPRHNGQMREYLLFKLP